MRHTTSWMGKSLRIAAALALFFALSSCEEDEEGPSSTVLGTWRWADAAAEKLLELRAGGLGLLVDTDLGDQSCTYITFTYAHDEDSLYLSFDDSSLEHVAYRLWGAGRQLTVNPGAGETIYQKVNAAADTTGCTHAGSAVEYEPEYADAVTGASGQVDLSLAHYVLHLSVRNASASPLQGASVQVLQGSASALAWVTLSGYYPSFAVIPLTGADSYTRVVTMSPAGGYFQVYTTDPPDLPALLADEAATAHCYQGTLADLLEAGLTTLGGYWCVRVTGEAADLGGGEPVTLGLFTSGMSEAAFTELMFGASSIMAADVVRYCLYSIDVDGSTWYLPFIQVDEVVEQAEDYEYKFILTWGQYPTDLDSYLFTPEIGGTDYVIYYGDPGSGDAPPYAWLDVDDTSSWGPEAITIEQLFPGLYYFWVDDYSGNGTISTSGAHVEVFRGRTRLGGVDVPTTTTGSNWSWLVGTVDGATGDFSLVNELYPPAEARPSLWPEARPLK